MKPNQGFFKLIARPFELSIYPFDNNGVLWKRTKQRQKNRQVLLSQVEKNHSALVYPHS